jgi:hypothetical protein
MTTPNFEIRSYALFVALSFVGVSCQHLETSVPDDPVPVKQIRVSDEYSRSAVESYEVYDVRIKQHQLALLHLRGGLTIPMVCRVADGGINPIPQSVFAVSRDSSEWNITCEPRIDFSYALMGLAVSYGDELRVGGREIRPLSDKPRLLHDDKTAHPDPVRS